jgi:hypothetical protein
MKAQFLILAVAILVASASPVFADSAEGVAIPLATAVVGGNVVVCEQASPCSLTNPTTWSDVIDFYNPAKGPFVPDTAQDATFVEVFSDGVGGQGSLANFLANYQGTLPPAVVPPGNFVVEGSDGTIKYASYVFGSPEAVPEPGTLSLLLVGGLLGLGMGRKRVSS